MLANARPIWLTKNCSASSGYQLRKYPTHNHQLADPWLDNGLLVSSLVSIKVVRL